MLILICGRSGSGKTSIANELVRDGYFVVSASKIAGAMFSSEYGYSPSRKELAQFGLKILTSSKESEFMHLVLQSIPHHEKVLIEGLRSINTIRYLQANHGAALALITRKSGFFLDGKNRMSGSGLDINNYAEEVDSFLDKEDFRPNIIVRNDGLILEACVAIVDFMDRFSGGDFECVSY